VALSITGNIGKQCSVACRNEREKGGVQTTTAVVVRRLERDPGTATIRRAQIVRQGGDETRKRLHSTAMKTRTRRAVHARAVVATARGRSGGRAAGAAVRRERRLQVWTTRARVKRANRGALLGMKWQIIRAMHTQNDTRPRETRRAAEIGADAAAT
jgi:hypothetical protein